MSKKASECKIKLIKPEWEIQPGESWPAWGSFKEYRDLGSERTMAKAAQLINKKLPTIVSFSVRYRWTDRIRAWERYLDEKRIIATVKAVEEMNQKAAKRASAAGDALMTVIIEYIKKYKEGKIDFERLAKKPGIFLEKLFRAAEKLATVTDIERKARGEPTEITKQTSSIEVKLPEEME